MNFKSVEAGEDEDEVFEPERLDDEAIAAAEFKINEMHPKARIGLGEAFPSICCCFKKPDWDDEAEKDFYKYCIAMNSQKLNATMATLKGRYKGRSFTRDALDSLDLLENEMTKKKRLAQIFKSKAVKAEDEDDSHFKKMASMMDIDSAEPTDDFGFGIASWIDLLRYLMCLFTFLSVIAMYLAYVYRSSGEITGGAYDYLAQWSLGNLGETESICFSQNVDLSSERTVKCNKGTLQKMTHFGAHAASEDSVLNSAASLYEGYSVGAAFCGNHQFLKEEDSCYSIVN